MFRLRLGGRVGIVASIVAGCGGSPPAPPVAPTVASAPAPGDHPVAAPLTPVAAPPELFVVGRVADLAKILDTTAAWGALPAGWRALLKKEIPNIDTVAALGAPLDFAAMLDPSSGGAPRVRWAFSVGVTGTAAAATLFRQRGFRVVSDVGGAYRVENGTLTCVDAPALGAAKARVVCSDQAEGAALLAPYMTRGLPTESFGASDLHVHFVAEPLRQRYAAQLALVRTVGVPFLLREVSLDRPKFDRALRDVLYSLADEVVALSYDLNRVDLDSALSPAKDAVDLDLSLTLSGERSFIGQTLTRAAGKGGPPPDFFWKLPSRSTSASYTAYADPEHTRGIAASLGELLDGLLDYEGLPEKRTAPLVTAFVDAMTTNSKAAYAALPAEATPAAAPSADPRDHFGRALLSDFSRGRLGVMDSGGDKVMALLSELVKSVGDRTLRAHLVNAKILRKDELPTALERAPKGAKGLPRDAKAYQFTLPSALIDEPLSLTPDTKKSAKTRAGKPLTVVLIAVPDGALTWFASGSDEKALLASIANARSGASDSLEHREGLASLRSTTALSAGFLSLGGFWQALAAQFGGGPRAAMDRLPHRGETPALWRVKSDANGPRETLHAHIPRQVFEDLVAFTATQVAATK